MAHPEQLVLLTDPSSTGIHIETREGGERSILSYPEFSELRVHDRVFSGMLAAESTVSNVDLRRGGSVSEEPVKARAQLVSGEFFSVLGVEAALGRTFTAAEDKAPGANPVAVISHGFWQREFGAGAAAIGKTFRLGAGSFEILGVAPPGFHGILQGS